MLRSPEMRSMQEVGFEWKGLLKMLKVTDIIRIKINSVFVKVISGIGI